jgi:hypothetical protein
LRDFRPWRHVPKIQPGQFEESEIFRETFLAWLGDHADNETFRRFGKLQYSMVLEYSKHGPHSWIDSTAHELQAVLADLRHLQGFLVRMKRHREDHDSVRESDEAVAQRHDALCELADRLSKKIGSLADELEKEVSDWKFE